MKKYFLGFFAVAVALSLASFTLQTRSASSTQDLYWFFYDENGVGAQIGSGPMSKEDAELLSCEDVPGEDCARGYASPTNPESTGNPHVDVIERELP